MSRSPTIKVIHGDMLTVLPAIEADSIAACVTDPPYHLIQGGIGLRSMMVNGKGNKLTSAARGGFMNAKWDGGDIAFRPETWAAVLRVLRPGGYLLAFGGTRTYHRLACAIEDAGFEIRDTIAWLYGSGFPKSLDISKAIDRAAGAEREVVGQRELTGKARVLKGGNYDGDYDGRELTTEYNITAPATDAARQWSGWGTSLKSAMEMVCVARKPLSERTVAANVLRHGTGGINVDACRVETSDGLGRVNRPDAATWGTYGSGPNAAALNGITARWPANVVHDGSADVLRGFPDRKTTWVEPKHANNRSGEFMGALGHPGEQGFNDDGSAARFFKECKWLPNESTDVNDAALTFDQPNGHAASALIHAVGQSTPPWALLPQSYQGRNTSVSVLELRIVCASVTALIQNIALRCSREWPLTNITLDNSPVVCVARPKQTGTMTITISLSKSDGFAELATFSITRTSVDHGAPGLAPDKRFHYTAKADRADRADSKHPTVKPVSLLTWLTRLVCPPGGTVMDPFAGTGSVGEACMLNGFNAVLIEREEQYAKDIEHRMKRWHGGDLPLFIPLPRVIDPEDERTADLFAEPRDE